MKNKKLPAKPSALLKLALSDLLWAEKRADIKIDMSEWFTRDNDGVCTVCMAGAVMARTLKLRDLVVPIVLGVSDFERYDSRLASQLSAIDCFRVGHVIEGLEELDIIVSYDLAEKIEGKYFAKYSFKTARPKFIAEMRRIIKFLKAEKL